MMMGDDEANAMREIPGSALSIGFNDRRISLPPAILSMDGDELISPGA